MPAYSGLWDGVFGEAYTGITKPRPPVTGLLRIALQRRGAYGYVRAFGGKAPATVKGVIRDRPDMQIRGGWDYATRADDPLNKVDFNNIGVAVDVPVNITMPATVVDAVALQRVRDIHLNRAYAKDSANLGVTAPALAERYAA